MIGSRSPLRGANRTYRLGIGLAAVGLVLTAGVLVAVSAVLSVRPMPAHEINVLGQQLAIPAANAQAIILLSLATLGISVVLAGTYGAVIVLTAHRRLRRALPVLDRLPGHDSVWVILGERPHAFCAGLLRPVVYVSTGALQELGDEELEAVLAHEQLHRMRRDPLRIASARVLGEALFFLPVLRRLAARYAALAELAADEHAVAALGGDTSPLAGAMLAFADNGIAPERVDHISGHTPDWSLPIALTALSAAGAGALALLVWQLARHAILQTTLGLPLLSAQPCVVILALVPLAGTALGMWTIRRTI
jgi:Zn-dependent protease with chaperone function